MASAAVSICGLTHGERIGKPECSTCGCAAAPVMSVHCLDCTVEYTWRYAQMAASRAALGF